MKQGATWLTRLAKPSALALRSVDLVNPLNLSGRPSTMLQTGEDTRYQVNLPATVSAKCFIVHHGYCTTVSGSCLPGSSADCEISGNEEPGVMMPGHCFTIEVRRQVVRHDSVMLTSGKPCLIQGSNPRSWIFPDGWTASTEVPVLFVFHTSTLTHDSPA